MKTVRYNGLKSWATNNSLNNTKRSYIKREKRSYYAKKLYNYLYRFNRKKNAFTLLLTFDFLLFDCVRKFNSVKNY